jgi:hypothetical protein
VTKILFLAFGGYTVHLQGLTAAKKLCIFPRAEYRAVEGIFEPANGTRTGNVASNGGHQ